jgi:uncharacterized protein YndB with AHSA1/START domain
VPQSVKEYTEPPKLSALPEEVVKELNADGFEKRAGEAIRLSTVGADGWPHGAQLSVGEVLSISPTELLIMTWPKSNTAENLRRDGRLTMSLVASGTLLEIRARAALVAEHQTRLDLCIFRVTIESINEHRSEYADVLTGITFRLHDPEKTYQRWREQIDVMKKLSRS